MGSLVKKPKIPKQVQQVVQYIPVQSTESASSEAASSAAAEESAAALAAENQQVREESLLRRSRGRLGTIFTGFSGFLQQRGDQQRKSLLGE